MLREDGDVHALMASRRATETAIDALLAELRALGYGPTHPPTVDAEGFPVADAAAVRVLRARLATLLGDHRRATAEIEAALPGAMAAAAAARAPRGIARVESVLPDSAGHSSGLCAGDVILSFGRVASSSIADNSETPVLAAIAQEYASCCASAAPLAVRVLRGAVPVLVTIRTAPNLALGVHILPI